MHVCTTDGLPGGIHRSKDLAKSGVPHVCVAGVPAGDVHGVACEDGLLVVGNGQRRRGQCGVVRVGGEGLAVLCVEVSAEGPGIEGDLRGGRGRKR